MPEVTVILPIFNAEQTLEKTLASLAAQTLTDFEVIMVDDVSSDRTVAIAEDWICQDPRFRLLRNEVNSGVSAVRNRALAEAKGRFLRFVDDDDTIPPESTEKMLAVAEETGADLVIGALWRDTLTERKPFPKTEALSRLKEISHNEKLLAHSFSLGNKLFRAEVVREHGLRFRDIAHSEDGTFCFEFMQVCGRIAGYDGIAYYYYRPMSHEAHSVTQDRSTKLLADLIEAFGRIRKTLAPEAKDLRHELDTRFLSTSLINGYYRRLWLLDAEGEKMLLDKIAEVSRLVTVEDIKRIQARHRDLELKQGFRTKVEICRKPFFTLVLSPELTGEDAEAVLDAAYQQDMPYFVVLMTETMRAELPARIARRENLFTLADGTAPAVYQEALRRAAAWDSLIAFLDEKVLFAKNALREARGKMKSRGMKMIAGRLTFPAAEGIGEADVHALATCFFDAATVNRSGFRFRGDRAADLTGLIRVCGYYHHFKLKYFTDRSPEQVQAMNLLTEEPAGLGVKASSPVGRKLRAGLGRLLFRLGCFLARRLLPLAKKRALLISERRARLDGELARYAETLPDEVEVLLDLRQSPDRTRNFREFLALIHHAGTCRYLAYEEGFAYAPCLKKRPGQEIVRIGETVLP